MNIIAFAFLYILYNENITFVKSLYFIYNFILLKALLLLTRVISIFSKYAKIKLGINIMSKEIILTENKIFSIALIDCKFYIITQHRN